MLCGRWVCPAVELVLQFGGRGSGGVGVGVVLRVVPYCGGVSRVFALAAVI